LVETKPFLLHGSRLELNFHEANPGGGSLLIEAVDHTGRPIPGFTREEAVVARGDHARYQAAWASANELGELVGSIVAFRFHMSDATLCAFQVRP